MKMKMPTINSNVKLITSNQAPTTSNLAKGEMAFGQVAGINSIYGNTGNGIIKIEFTSSGEPIIYFANEEALSTFVKGNDVPTSGWYAAIADSILGGEPEPATPYAQVSLSATLSDGTNSVKLSDYKGTGTLESPQVIYLADDYTLKMDYISNGNTKFTIDASILFFGLPDFDFPSLQLNIVQRGVSLYTWIVDPVYYQDSKIVRWQGQIEKNLEMLIPTTYSDISVLLDPLELHIVVMQYYEGDAPTLSGTLKIEDGS